MMKNFVTFIGIMTMFLLGITNYTVGNYDDSYYYGNSNNSEYIRINDEESVRKYTSSIFYNENGNIVWNLDSKELIKAPLRFRNPIYLYYGGEENDFKRSTWTYLNIYSYIWAMYHWIHI